MDLKGCSVANQDLSATQWHGYGHVRRRWQRYLVGYMYVVSYKSKYGRVQVGL